MALGRIFRAVYRAATNPAARRAYRDQLSLRLERRRTLTRHTYAPDPPLRPLPGSPFASLALAIEPATARQITALADLYLAHRFHLLGSGWLPDRFSGPFPGLEGVTFSPPSLPPPDSWFAAHVSPANRPTALRLARLLDPGYQPIDWHTDRRTGFRFDPLSYHRDLAYPPGADPKMPWELARCHHLPVLALAARLSGNPGYAREVRNQILDFSAANPPAFGLHWADGLEIAIRAANWIFALHLLTASGFTFEPEFYRAFDRSIAEHARLQARYLPWEGDSRGNHYLGSLVGLLFESAWLPESAETNAWLAFALAELSAEALYEFHPDGSHFEAATAYHLFCADLLAWSLAWMAAIPVDRLDRLRSITPPRLIWRDHTPAPLVWSRLPSGRELPVDPRLLDRLPRIAAFLRDIRRPDGQILQIGDCDSGRLFSFGLTWTPLDPDDALATFANLTPPAIDGLAEHWEPQPNNPTDVLAALDPLLSGSHSVHLCSQFVAALIPSPLATPVLAPPPPPSIRTLPQPAPPVPTPAIRRSALSFPAPPSGPPLTDQLSVTAYPDFGLYLYRSPRLFLAIRCSNSPGPVNRGHAHNDELGIEVWIDGQPHALDPGTFVYTRLAAVRNRYRAAAAHYVPHCEGHEPRRLSYDLFRFAEPAASQCLICRPEEFLGRLDAPPVPLLRHIRITPTAVEVTDLALADPPAPLRSGPSQPQPFSSAYGVVYAAARHPDR